MCKPGKHQLRAGTLLRPFDESVHGDGLQNHVTHANLLEELSLISDTIGNTFLEAMAKDKTLQQVINTVTERRLGNYISIQITAFCNLYCGEWIKKLIVPKILQLYVYICVRIL